MSQIRLKLAPPWITYVNELIALFGNDPEISVVYDNDDVEVKLYVESETKAGALSVLLPEEKKIGSITLKITIVPANDFGTEAFNKLTNKALFDYAFENNPAYAYTKEVTGFFSNAIYFVVFKNKVVQFFNDNLNDIHGLVSTLYETIARDIFEDAGLQGVNYNTDIEEKVFGMPLGEWP